MNTPNSTIHLQPNSCRLRRIVRCLKASILMLLIAAWAWRGAADPGYNVSSTMTPSCGLLTPCNPVGSLTVLVTATEYGIENYCLGQWVTNWTITSASGVIKYTDDGSGTLIWNGVSAPDFTVGISPDKWSCWITRYDSTKPQTITVSCTVMLLDVISHDVVIPYPVSDDTITATFEIADRGSCDGSDDGPDGCAGDGCSSCGSDSSPILGTASPNVNQGPYVSWNLGALSKDKNAGVLLLDGKDTSASLWSPAALYVPYNRSAPQATVDIVTNGSGVVEQINSPTGLINVNVIDSYHYQLQMFYEINVTPKSGGFYGTNAAAFSIWTIANPDGGSATNRLTVTESRPGLADRQFTYAYTNSGGTNFCWMTDGDGLRTTVTWQVQDAYDSTQTNVFLQVLSGSTVVQMIQKNYAYTSGQRRLIQQIDGMGTATNITTRTYDGYGNIQSVYYPNGNWESYYYSAPGVLAYKQSAFADSTYNQEVDYDNYSYVDGDLGFSMPKARRERVSLPDSSGSLREISRIYRSTPAVDEVDEYQCANPLAEWNDSANLITKTVTFIDPSDPNTYMKTKWQVRPDLTATIYQYQEDGGGVLTNLVMMVGQPDSTNAPTTILDGMVTSTALNSLGQPTQVTTQVMSNGTPTIITSRLTYTYTDNLNLSYFVVDLGGNTNIYEYACCGLESATDPDGVVTLYTYDSLKRLVATEIVRGSTGITTTNIIDPAGRVLVTQRIGTNGSASTITVQQTLFDILGNAIRETNALQGVVISSNVLIGHQIYSTNIFPDGGTRIAQFYQDGSLASVTGTAVAPVRYIYGVETDGSGGSYRAFTLTVKIAADGGTNEWTKTYRDGLGRPYKTIYATPSGTPPSSISYYNTKGQLAQAIDPDGVSMVYGYGLKGEQVYTVLDTNRDGAINFSGSDRITLKTNDVIAESSAHVFRTSVYNWPSSADSPILISKSEASVDGKTNWFTRYVDSGSSSVSGKQIIVYGTNGLRYETNIAPDSSFSVSAYQYGKLLSVTKTNGSTQIGSITYTYDPHSRVIIVNDTGSGSITNYYNAMDQICGIGAPLSQVTSNYFDNMGRITSTVMPDGTTKFTEYYTTGNIKRQYGSRTFPVGYGYDSQGRMTTMSNWTGFASSSGVRVTTWNYDAYRGFLSSKTYDGATAGPSYTYTLAGRLLTRNWARGVNTTNTYNYAGDLASVSYSDSTAGITYDYDRLGRQITITTGSGGSAVVCSKTYNEQHQPLVESYTGGPLNNCSVSNIYNGLLLSTNLSIGRGSSGAIYLTTSSYDGASRLQQVTDGTNAATYTYIADSPLVSQIAFAHNGSTVMTTTKTYDALNRLSSISSANASAVVLDSHGYGYNLANQRTVITNTDGTYWVYQYDGLGQMISGKQYWNTGAYIPGQQFGYDFDDIGNRTSSQAGGDEFGVNLRRASYTANSLNEYTSRSVPGAVDIIGSATNLATVTVNDLASYRHNDYYRVELPVDNSGGPVWQSVSNLAVLRESGSSDIVSNYVGNVYLPQSTETFAYDADGNLTQDGRWTYTWDAENRLISMTSLSNAPAASKLKLDFAYDYLGRRIQKKVSVWNGTSYTATSTNSLIYDGRNLLASIDTPSFALRSSFMWGSDVSGSRHGAGGVGGLLAVTQYAPTNQQQFVAFDGNGNVAALVDSATGAVAGRYEYDPFGGCINCSGPAASANPFRFSTKYTDVESDLIYYGFRFYNPQTGRWLNRDPLGEPGALNLYSFALNDPQDYFDVDGRFLNWFGGFVSVAFSAAFHYISGEPYGFQEILTDFAFGSLGPGAFKACKKLYGLIKDCRKLKAEARVLVRAQQVVRTATDSAIGDNARAYVERTIRAQWSVRIQMKEKVWEASGIFVFQSVKYLAKKDVKNWLNTTDTIDASMKQSTPGDGTSCTCIRIDTTHSESAPIISPEAPEAPPIFLPTPPEVPSPSP